MIKNVLFDLDGTIINSEQGILEGIRIAMTKYGYELPEYSILRKCIGPPFSETFPKYFNVTSEDYPKVLAAYREFYDNGGMLKCSIYDGVIELLEALKNRGYALIICSSKPETACRSLLSQLNIDSYFTDIAGSSLDGKIDKKEQVIELCFKRMPWMKKKETILVGDTLFDAKGAGKTNIKCIGVTWGFGTKAELLDAGALEAFGNYKEVIEYIENN